MIIMPFQLRGLGSPSKKSKFCRLIEVKKTCVIMLLEIVGNGDKITKDLSKFRNDSNFFYINYVRGLEKLMSPFIHGAS